MIKLQENEVFVFSSHNEEMCCEEAFDSTFKLIRHEDKFNYICEVLTGPCLKCCSFDRSCIMNEYELEDGIIIVSERSMNRNGANK